ncbi:MAG: peptidyl-prolyl cis-trans isomerase [Erythrobacter sp.]|nr:peptidyl-prolyl cis-trans isomerase [Erythrobacter sp.]
MRRPDWTGEPLVHFLVAGAVIFALFAWRGEVADPSSRTISVDREQQAQIALGFERMMQRPPTDAELDSQIERFVRDEVLYREALRLGLDRDDAVVRRRLAQKMDMLASAQAETARPSDAVLHAWLRAHPERFADETRYSLDQLWFASETAASMAVEKVNGANDWQQLGQPISLPASLDQAARDEVLARYGEQFLAGIDRLDPGEQWQGPVQSGFGWHLVRLRARKPGEPRPFSEVAERVENDWRTSTIAVRREEAYRLLRDAYRVEIAR